MFLHITGHVESHGEREVSVDFLLEHRQHVERVPHRVEAQDTREFLEACPGNITINV